MLKTSALKVQQSGTRPKSTFCNNSDAETAKNQSKEPDQGPSLYGSSVMQTGEDLSNISETLNYFGKCIL